MCCSKEGGLIIVIGIAGNGKNGKVKLSKYFKDNYSFIYFDVDELISNILKEKYYADKMKTTDWKNDTEFLLRLRNEIDERIRLLLNSLNDNDIIVIDYSLLEDSYIFDKADVVMKVNNITSQIIESDVGLMLKHRLNSLQGEYSNSKYHFEINYDEEWENKISGKISKCYYPLLIEVLNKKYGTNFELSENDYVELSTVQNGWDVIEQLNNRIPFCDYCREEIEEFDWESHFKNDKYVSNFVLKKIK